MKFLKLIRFQNLLMIALMQFIFKYGFLDQQNIPLALNDWQYFLLVFTTVLLAGAGYLINNIFDKETDFINKPNEVVVGKYISEDKAFNLYIALNIIGVGTGFYLANVIEKPAFALVFILVSAVLYLYASSLKQSLLIGNIIVAILTSFAVIIIGIFNLYPLITPENQAFLGLIFRVLLDYAIFAFIINFIREIVKDLEDVNGDYNQGMNTLPIALGVTRTARLVFLISFIPIVILLYYINEYYFINGLYIATIYCLLLIVAPLIYFTVKSASAKNKEDFHHLSLVLKFVLLFGILSALVVNLNIQLNA
ncbi:4-hydroxybenzoate polyprenyltransferase [Flavobacterium arsenatis]|uniref:4-hydroxybenzoate polyprenyltransferase n=1 Tax=Flavobacterium arsenatis TaxID=1484332 RepID=A0ABU1TRS8_9FLAO|nr:geranylgeranylglycerol-phosphate geranylgeranyltransferase [Flavobacterium arsenatis]MDR6968573.1 4-hydroxybenzoate polyprenyltransferase [Flavobacterium arsenatis]